jgi:hypothetical protein
MRKLLTPVDLWLKAHTVGWAPPERRAHRIFYSLVDVTARGIRRQ